MFNEIKEKLESTKYIIISTISIILSLIILILKNLGYITINNYIDPAWITIVISGYPIIYEAIDELKDKHISSELLVVIALISSIILGEIFAAGEVCFIMSIGELLEDKTIDKAKKGLENLISLIPKNANVVVNNKTIKTDIKDVKVNDIIRILPGDKIPMDGIIVSGSSSINESILTGESMMKDVSISSLVYQGTQNLNGSFDFKVTKTMENTALNQMISLIENATNNEPPIKKTADKWASILVPLSVGVALLTGILTYIFIGNNNNEAIIRAVTILVTFCPCALTLSTPTSIMASIGQATKYGVLIKNGVALEELARTNSICFDKTGTLTTAKISVCDVISYSNYKIEEIIKIAKSLESKSEHPLSKAISTYRDDIKTYNVSSFNSITGKGITGVINNKTYYIGSINFLIDKIKSNVLDDINKYLDQGKAIILLSNSIEIIGLFTLNDTVKSESSTVIKDIKDLGYNVNLLTGDNKKIANTLAAELKIDNVYSELLPTDKAIIIDKLNKEYKTIMIGDGVNDAPSLKKANVGISFASIASDITLDCADIVFLNDDITKLPYVIKLARKTLSTIKFNISLSLIINIIAVTLGALGLLTPITGAIVHNIGSVIVVLNAALLINKKIK